MRYRPMLLTLICCYPLVLLWYHLRLPNREGQSDDSFVQEPVRGGRNIVLLETRCALDLDALRSWPGLHLNARQACTVESAATMNPHSTVYVLHTCPVNGFLNESKGYVNELFNFPNIRLWPLDVPSYLRDTPLQHWNFTEHIRRSKWPVEHSSDVLRFLTLWKYGGTYIDLDVLIIDSLLDLETNYVIKESADATGSCVLNFEPEGIGRIASEMCLNEILRDFRGDLWAHNAADLVTRVLQQLCDTNKVKEMSAERCRGVRLLSEKHFTPNAYTAWRRMFTGFNLAQTLEGFLPSYGVHMWNSLSHTESLHIGLKTPYVLLAKMFCPRVYSHIFHL